MLTHRVDGTWERSTLLDALDRPHGIALHEGMLYVAEPARIVRVRYPLVGTAPPSPETVIEGLPAEGRHPHKTLGFGPDGMLYFSVGSATDNCAPDGASGPEAGEDPCVEASPTPVETSRAAVRRWDPAHAGRGTQVFAHGLRNNLGFDWHPGAGTMWGVENSRDYIMRADPQLADATLPHDELNELVAGGDYGWPYCYDHNLSAPEYAAHGVASRCGAGVRAPAIELPPHSAPISIHFYRGALFPEVYRGRAFVTYHGYRAEGHRLVSIPFGPDGRPTGAPEDFITGWEERPGRPHGHLLGLAEAPDGTLYLSDDGSGAVYAIAYGRSALAAPAIVPAPLPPEDPAVVDARCAELAQRHDALAVLQRTVFDVKCVPCHGATAGALTLRRCDWRDTYESLVHGRSETYGPYLVPGHPDQGYLMARLHGDSMGPRMPPQGVSLAPEELAAIEAWVRAGARPP